MDVDEDEDSDGVGDACEIARGDLNLDGVVGGADVPLAEAIAQPRFYLSLDWVLLDLVVMAFLFIHIELFFRLKPEQGGIVALCCGLQSAA